MYPFWNCVAVLPPHPIQSWNLKKILDICIQLCLWVEGRVLELCELENTPEMQKCPKAFIHDFRIVCLVFQIPDCPTIPILLGSSQFCLKIRNRDQYFIGTGKILIVTSVVINKPEQLPQTVLNWNWYPENLNISPEILKNLLLVWENMQIKIGIKITFNLANILERNQPLNTRTTFQSIKISKFLG